MAPLDLMSLAPEQKQAVSTGWSEGGGAIQKNTESAVSLKEIARKMHGKLSGISSH